MTYSCCNHHALPRLGGGVWVFEPRLELGALMWRLMSHGQPALFFNGTIDTTQGPSTWHMGDLALATHAFSDWHHSEYGGYWPKVADKRHGFAPGLRLLPAYKEMNDSEFALATTYHGTSSAMAEGFLPELHNPRCTGGRLGFGLPGVEWHALSLVFGQCIGNVCECPNIVGRDLPNDFRTVHLGCLRLGLRPGEYESEAAFMQAAYRYATSCTRHYYRIWFDTLGRTGYTWPGPQWTGLPLPGVNATHDALVLAWRREDGLTPRFK